MFLALLSAPAALPAQLGPAWGEFSRRPALRRMSESVEIGTLGMDRQTKKLRYWLRYTKAGHGAVTTRWADSKTCPEVTGILERMQGLSMPQPAAPGIGEEKEIEITLDGIGYSLRAPAQFGRKVGNFTMSSNVGTPLAQWTDDSFRRLEACWTETQPKRNP
jgi:hypothetical protein